VSYFEISHKCLDELFSLLLCSEESQHRYFFVIFEETS